MRLGGKDKTKAQWRTGSGIRTKGETGERTRNKLGSRKQGKTRRKPKTVESRADGTR